MGQECGVGEVPSLPRVLPKILINTFSYLGMGEIIATDMLKAQVANCFSKVKDLLIMFLTLMEKIKTRKVLEENELDILVDLCFELPRGPDSIRLQADLHGVEGVREADLHPPYQA